MDDVNDRFFDAFEEFTTEAVARWHDENGHGRRVNNRDAVWWLVNRGQLDGTYAQLYDELKPLRDVLAHRRVDGQTPCYVREISVQTMERLRDRLCGKVTSLKPFRSEVTTVRQDTTVGEACRIMADMDYSVLPVVSADGVNALLSADDLVHWVGQHLGEVGLLEDVPVCEVMSAHPSVDYRVVGLRTPARDVPPMFLERPEGERNLGAVLITATGVSHERLLGILTAWDLPRLRALA